MVLPLIPVVIITAVAAVAGIGSYFWLGNNNPVEQAAESAIQAETGVKPDLSAIAQEIHIVTSSGHQISIAGPSAPANYGPPPATGANGPASQP